MAILFSALKKAAGPVRTASASASETNSKGKTYSGRGGYTGKPGFISDIQMGIGMVPKDQYYYSRTAATKARSAPISRTEYGNDGRRPAPTPAPRQPTAAELRAQRKAAELAERKRLGQIARKKFEKEKGERVAKKRATLLNIT
jgi:hypothetical protein